MIEERDPAEPVTVFDFIVCPASKVEDNDLRALVASALPLRAVLGGLFLRGGRYIPDELKRASAIRFGFCDSAGRVCRRESATHFGVSPAGPRPTPGPFSAYASPPE